MDFLRIRILKNSFLLLYFLNLTYSASILKFGDIFTNGKSAILQHGVDVLVWGSGAQAGASVTVTISTNVTVHCKADSEGKWQATIPPQPVSWNIPLTAYSHESTKIMVSFGVVVLCSGQSNMDMPVACHLPNRTQCDYPKRVFRADNGSAEVAAAGRYANKIWMIKAVQSRFAASKPTWTTASTSDSTSKSFPAAFSAVCWYTGKTLFERLGGNTPVGLMQASVGGSPIEYWLPPGYALNACGYTDKPQCDNQYDDSFFYTDIVSQFVPYTIGALVWDQAERDVKCPASLNNYSCLQRLLTNSWREKFQSNVPFVAVQLPGYTAAINNGTGHYPGFISAESVFHMRLQQAQGASNLTKNAGYVVTYDMSCALDSGCPYGSVHNVEKVPIGERVANKLIQLLTEDNTVADGPQVKSARILSNDGQGGYQIGVEFTGSSFPYRFSPTKNCTVCCEGNEPYGKTTDGHTIDFDVNTFENPGFWVNSTGAILDGSIVKFHVKLPNGYRPQVLRHTASSIFPQCALRNAEGLPAAPFRINIGMDNKMLII